MKNKKRLGLSIIVLIAIILFAVIFSKISMTGFAIDVNENKSNIITTYGPNEILKGYVNMSLDDEEFDSQLTGFNTNISILDFLLANNMQQNNNFTCTAPDCSMDYAAFNSSSSKTIILDKDESAVIGFEITDSVDIDDILNISFNISSDAGQSCSNSLIVDILDNNDTETMWQSDVSAGVYDSCALDDPTGGYESAYRVASPAELETGERYCNRIEIEPCPDLEIGANIMGTGSIDIEMSIFAPEGESYEESCTDTISATGEASCVINKSIDSKRIFYVCVERESGGVYTMNYDKHSANGYWTGEGEYVKYDWNVFARPGAYASFGSSKIDSTKIEYLESEVYSYIANSNRYNSDCSDGCIIPIKITSKKDNQEITASDFFLKYPSGPSKPEITVAHDLSSTPSKITMPYTKLDISKAGIKVPSSYGNNTLKLELDGETILEKKINIVQKPVIKSVSPSVVPAGANIVFSAEVTGANITSYKWKFGDNSSAVDTTKNKATHKYGSIGVYTLTLNVKNSLGEANKTFTIEATNPKEYLNDTLKEKQEDIDTVRAQLNNLSSWEKTYLDSRVNLTSLETELAQLKTEFDGAGGSSEKYIEILEKLNDLKIPTYLESKYNSTGQFLVDKSKIKLSDLEALGAGTPDQGTEDQYKESVYGWAYNSLNINMEERVYSFYYEDTLDYLHIASRYRVTISPKVEPIEEEVYVVINKRKNDIGFKDLGSQAQNLNGSTGLTFSSLTNAKDIYFMLPGQVSLLDTPIYFATGFEEMAVIAGIGFGPCNYNEVCEADRGEDWRNCRNDCYPWGWFIFWLILLLLIFLIIYIALQEWYKRHYEDHLFPDKNDLFNLINFIDNAEKHGMKKEEIFKKLREKGWNNEQINYAYKKLKGQRTGMWEIPVFKFIEKRKVKEELEKRKKIGYKGVPSKKPVTKPVPSQKHPMKGKKPMPGMKPGMKRPGAQPFRKMPPGRRPMPGQKPMPGMMNRPGAKKPEEKEKKGLKALFSKKVTIPTGKKPEKK